MKPNNDLDQRMLDAGYVSIPEAERRTEVHRQTIYDAIGRGSLASKRVGRRHYLEIEEFLQWAGEGARLLWDTAAAS